MKSRFASVVLLFLAGACASAPQPPVPAPLSLAAPADPMKVANRLTWGVNAVLRKEIEADGVARYLQRQLEPRAGDALPEAVAARIAAMEISRKPVAELLGEIQRQRREMEAIADDAGKMAAQQALQQRLTVIAREAAARSLLRAVHSRNQLHEHMTWFWMNHFNVHQFKLNLRALVGDYEERAIRPHALGRFRDLLGATVRHPAMLIYLDNARNAAGGLNENYARELLELHTLGIDGGYTQGDVQELARVLTGVGVNPRQPGTFQFQPRRHDFGTKTLLGREVRGRGMAEVDEVLDLLSRHPSTARHVSRKLAVFFVADEPPPQLVERMAKSFRESDGEIAAVLRTMIESREFAASLGGKFKDPVHYLVSAARLAFDDRPVPDPLALVNALNRMGQGLYNRQTPDGYPLTEPAWSSPGQLTTRFEVARAMGLRLAALRGAAPEATLAESTRAALAEAATPQERNVLLLSSPDFMYR